MNTTLATHSESLSNGTVLNHGSTASSPRPVEPRRRSTLLGGLALLVSACSLLMGCVEGDGGVEDFEDFEEVGDFEEVEDVGEAAQAITQTFYGNDGTTSFHCNLTANPAYYSSTGVAAKGKFSCKKTSTNTNYYLPNAKFTIKIKRNGADWGSKDYTATGHSTLEHTFWKACQSNAWYRTQVLLSVTYSNGTSSLFKLYENSVYITSCA